MEQSQPITENRKKNSWLPSFLPSQRGLKMKVLDRKELP
jgi:hypothetical protein